MTTGRWASLRRRVVAAGAALTFVVLGGATYQGVATSIERRRLPHPGRLIDAGGHQLHLDCTGQGEPVVVLEAPAAGFSAVWGWVQQDLSAITRVCSYDRSGLGWSEAGDRSSEPSAAVDALHTLIANAGERRPVIMTGHELGAALATVYAARYRSDVAALVLVDPPAAGDGPADTRLTRWPAALPWLARTGLLRATRALAPYADGLPEASATAVSAFLYRPDHLTRAAFELSQWHETVHLATTATLDPDLPVVRLEGTRSQPSAFLNDASQAHAVAAEIARLVERTRSGP